MSSKNAYTEKKIKKQKTNTCSTEKFTSKIFPNAQFYTENY